MNPQERLEKLKERKRFDVLKTQARKRDFIATHKKSIGCADCGYNLHSCALDLHHLYPEEKGSQLKKGVDWRNLAWNTIKVELLLCEVLCSNCHRIRHMEESPIEVL